MPRISCSIGSRRPLKMPFVSLISFNFNHQRSSMKWRTFVTLRSMVDGTRSTWVWLIRNLPLTTLNPVKPNLEWYYRRRRVLVQRIQELFYFALNLSSRNENLTIHWYCCFSIFRKSADTAASTRGQTKLQVRLGRNLYSSRLLECTIR